MALMIGQDFYSFLKALFEKLNQVEQQEHLQIKGMAKVIAEAQRHFLEKTVVSNS